MNRIVKFLIVISLAGFISACSNTFKSNVSRFHELPAPKGETVMIVPLDSAKNTSLEFASYANIVGNYLERQGYSPASNDDADLIVQLDYSVDDGKVMVRSYSFGYGYGGYGYGYGYGGYGFGHFGGYFGHYGGYGGYGGFGSGGGDIRSYVNYTRKLSMIIRPNVEGEMNLFEGTVESTGRSNDLALLMPRMAQAMFTNFPGESGVTNKVVIDLDKE